MRSYVAGAVRDGTIASATFRVRGDLWDFPVPRRRRSARDGDFRIAAKVEGLTFAYVPDEARRTRGAGGARASRGRRSPAVSGELVVDRSTLDIRNARAQLGDVEWSGIQGRDRASSAAAPRLEIEGTARGPLAEMLRFVNATPVGALDRQGARRRQRHRQRPSSSSRSASR